MQPFADINKRTSRLAANAPLFRANLCPLTFVDVPADGYAQAMLGIYEMGRVELLRDLFIWAYERSTQEYVAIRQQLAEPDPLRLQHRSLIKDCVPWCCSPMVMRKPCWTPPCPPTFPNLSARPCAR